jgi:hypothetical protein
MRRTTIILVLLAILSSCKDKPKNADSTTKTKSIGDTAVPFHGLWVNKKHIDSLVATKSPTTVQGSEVFMKIPQGIGNNVETYNYHEGLDIFSIVKNGSDFYLKSANDSTTIRVSESGTEMFIGGMEYKKVADNPRLAEIFLFKGTFSDGKTTLTFKANGHVEGFDDSHFYFVENDYASGPGDKSLNIIYIGNSPEQKGVRAFAFQFHEDTLLIYNTACAQMHTDGSCDGFKKKSLKWTLVKQ